MFVGCAGAMYLYIENILTLYYRTIAVHLKKMVEKLKVKKYNTNEHICEKIHYDEHDIDGRTVSLYTMYIEFSNVMDM